MTDSLLSTFNALNPIEKKVGELVDVELAREEERKGIQSVKIENDYDLTRKNLIGLLNTAQEALDYAMLMAKDSEEPRAFEVVGQLLEKVSNINEKLLTLSEKKQKLDSNSGTQVSHQTSGQTTYNNTFYTGSTSDLKQLIDSMKGQK